MNPRIGTDRLFVPVELARGARVKSRFLSTQPRPTTAATAAPAAPEQRVLASILPSLKPHFGRGLVRFARQLGRESEFRPLGFPTPGLRCSTAPRNVGRSSVRAGAALLVADALWARRAHSWSRKKCWCVGLLPVLLVGLFENSPVRSPVCKG